MGASSVKALGPSNDLQKTFFPGDGTNPYQVTFVNAKKAGVTSGKFLDGIHTNWTWAFETGSDNIIVYDATGKAVQKFVGAANSANTNGPVNGLNGSPGGSWGP
jgi:hypothetical protein